MTKSVTDELIALIARELNIAVDRLTPATPIFEDGLDLDSFAVVDLVSRIEGHFGFRLTDDDFRPENFQTIQTLADVVARSVAAKA